MRGTIVEENIEEDGCTLEGCRGYAVLVRWADGREAWKCSRGLFWDANNVVYTPTEEE